ncbi:non-specific serine/threonine protein kinase [Trifolium repens]|nr:non-specific serine/threonine protein kinase [Trifolium repens]
MLLLFWSICCLVLFLLFTSNFLNKSASALGNETDHSALLIFKKSITSDPFGVLDSWNSSNHFCKWDGVTCGRRHQRVTKIELEGYQLQGSISPHVGNLSFLRILYLDNNRFYANIPRELGRLFRLQAISLANNTLGGQFPISLINCSQLREIGLDGNHFIGQIPMDIHSLTKLHFFSVAKNNLTGQIPPSIWNLSSLTVLSFAYNYLEGNIPEEIGLLKNLTKMSVSQNGLSGILPLSLYNMSSLTDLYTAGNQFHGSLPNNMFTTLPNLRKFLFGANQYSGPIPTSISNASHMQLFDIGHNNFVGQIPNLGKLQNLSILAVGENNLGSNSSSTGNDWDFIKSLVNCSYLDIIFVESNNFGGPLPKIIGNLSTHLSQLAMASNLISGKIPTELGNLVNLIFLSIEDNLLIDVIPESFSKLHKMQELFLKINKLSGEIPATILGNLSQLSLLDLSYNLLVGKIPSTIGSCKALQGVDFSVNNLSGAIPTELLGLSSLSVLLNLSQNSLSGNLPPEVGLLQNIERLDVSENHLSGGIPTKIGDCSSLEYLFLEGNSLDGNIPSSLSSLKGLLQLDLSRNNLSGSIPQELQNNSVLEWFNASFNKLEGEVPLLGIFQNASRVSLTGNDGLCGGVSKLNLRLCPPKDLKKKKHHTHRKLIIIIFSIAFLLLLSFVLTFFIYKIMRKRQRKASTDSTIEQLPKVSYQELHHATDGFSIQNLIGTGGVGFVYKGRLNSEERVVAIKVLNLQKKGAHKSFIAECNAFRNIRHRNLVKIITCCSSVDHKGNDFKAIVYEYMTNGSLEEWLHQNAEQQKTLKLEERLEIVFGIASALHYLHYECEKPIVHCDLKPSNVLLDDDMVAHVSDFGLAKLVSTIDGNSNNQTSSMGIKGTIGYTPPEYGMDSQLSTEGDMYSFGILLLEMLTGRRPTDDIFKEGHNLHNYVKIAFPNNILEIVDATLLSMENENLAVTTTVASDLHPNVERCLSSLFKIGLSCSVESPRERVNIKDVITELNIISKTLADPRD